MPFVAACEGATPEATKACCGETPVAVTDATKEVTRVTISDQIDSLASTDA